MQHLGETLAREGPFPANFGKKGRASVLTERGGPPRRVVPKIMNQTHRSSVFEEAVFLILVNQKADHGHGQWHKRLHKRNEVPHNITHHTHNNGITFAGKHGQRRVILTVWRFF
jgi:hypothetical protein